MQTRPFTRWIAATLAVVIAAPTAAAAPGRDAPLVRTLAKQFCDAVVRGDEAAARARLAPVLDAPIRRALAINAAAATADPQAKPPLGDGLKWTSEPDMAASCAVTGVRGRTVTVEYVFAGSPPGRWRDRLQVVRMPDKNWKVADILYGEAGDDSFRRWLIAVTRTRQPV